MGSILEVIYVVSPWLVSNIGRKHKKPRYHRFCLSFRDQCEFRIIATKKIISLKDIDDGIRICLGTTSTAYVLPRKQHIPEGLASSR